MTWLTQGKSFREKRADWPTGALGLARADSSLDAAESVDLPQMSRGGTCWGGQGCQEQPPIWWIPRSARRRKSIKAGARASSLPHTRGAAQQQALPARRPNTTHHGQWRASPLTLPPSHCLSPSPTPAETEESQRTQKPPLSGAQHQRRQPACLRLRYFLQQIFTYSQLQSKHIGATEIGDTVPTLKKLTGCERARRQCLYTTRQQVPSQEGGRFLGGALTSAKDTGGKGAREVLRRQWSELCTGIS